LQQRLTTWQQSIGDPLLKPTTPGKIAPVFR